MILDNIVLCSVSINILNETYPKLTFAVNQRAFWCLTGVNCKSAGETFGSALVEPVTNNYHMCS